MIKGTMMSASFACGVMNLIPVERGSAYNPQAVGISGSGT
jgi:hypothetical protein